MGRVEIQLCLTPMLDFAVASNAQHSSKPTVVSYGNYSAASIVHLGKFVSVIYPAATARWNLPLTKFPERFDFCLITRFSRCFAAYFIWIRRCDRDDKDRYNCAGACVCVGSAVFIEEWALKRPGFSGGGFI
jgi:drug/metabolite transporter superfamily protein YnfA